LDHFSHGKTFVLIEITFFRSNFCENSPIKKTLVKRKFEQSAKRSARVPGQGGRGRQRQLAVAAEQKI
jgi:hypothetical protein